MFLIQVGGYTTPFVVLGSALFTTAVMTIFILPVHSNSNQTNPNTVGEYGDYPYDIITIQIDP